MATVNFSVPDEVKERFDRAFGDQNKSAIIAELMRRAVAEDERRKRRERLFQSLTKARPRRGARTSAEIRKARETGRA